MGMPGSIMVEGDHEGGHIDFLFEHKHHKIQQMPSHTSKDVATNNLETLTPWLVESKMACSQNIMPSLKNLKLHKAIINI